MPIQVDYTQQEVLDAFFADLSPADQAEWDQVIEPVLPAPVTPSELPAAEVMTAPGGQGAGTPNEAAWRAIEWHLTRQFLELWNREPT